MANSKGGTGEGRIRFRDTSYLKVPGIQKKGSQHLKPPPKPPAKPPKS